MLEVWKQEILQHQNITIQCRLFCLMGGMRMPTDIIRFLYTILSITLMPWLTFHIKLVEDIEIY